MQRFWVETVSSLGKPQLGAARTVAYPYGTPADPVYAMSLSEHNGCAQTFSGDADIVNGRAGAGDSKPPHSKPPNSKPPNSNKPRLSGAYCCH